MTQNNNSLYKLISILLTILLVIVVFKNYRELNKTKEKENILKEESVIIQSQLSEMINQYDSLIDLYNSNYKKSNNTLDSTINPAASINEQIKSIEDSILVLKTKLKYLEQIKSELIISKKVYKKNENSGKLIVKNFNVKGVKFGNTNPHVSKASTIDQLRVCFTLLQNKVIQSGEKTFYIQVLNPKNETITKEGFIIPNSKIAYTKLLKLNYKKQAMDVCEFLEIDKKELIKGSYIITLYTNDNEVAQSYLTIN